MYDKETSFRAINYNLVTPTIEKYASAFSSLNPYDPEFLYVWVRAISAGEYWGMNRNSDYFAERELLNSYHTFLDSHVFTNHQNKDVANSIGEVLEAKWDSVMKYVELLLKIDRQLAPKVVRGFEKGYTTDVSMGCRVQHTICSICGNVAKTRAEFCDCVKYHRGEIYPDGRRVFEHNINPRFHDISVVLNGADRTAKILEIVSPSATKRTPILAGPPLPILGAEKVAFVNIPTDIPILKKADIHKEIVDKLYTLALLNRAPWDPELDVVLGDAVSAGVPLELELSKTAGVFKDVRNVALGLTGIGLATNYYQGKRMRGEDLNTAQNFIADNPGLLPLAFMFAGYPGYKRLKVRADKVAPKTEQYLSDVKSFFSKDASELEDYTFENTVDIFRSKDIDTMYKNAYNSDEQKLSLTKLALLRIDDSQMQERLAGQGITDEDLTNFVKVSYDYIYDILEKEANYASTVLTLGLANTHKIPTGLQAPSIFGLLVDGYLLDKFLDGKVRKEKKEVTDKVINDVVGTLPS